VVGGPDCRAVRCPDCRAVRCPDGGVVDAGRCETCGAVRRVVRCPGGGRVDAGRRETCGSACGLVRCAVGRPVCGPADRSDLGSVDGSARGVAVAAVGGGRGAAGGGGDECDRRENEHESKLHRDTPW
jgi:hypothetical protein